MKKFALAVGLLLVHGPFAHAAVADDDEDAAECEDVKSCAAGCEKGDGDDCFDTATMYYDGGDDGADADPKKARTYFEKACNLGETDGCVEAGLLYEEAAAGIDFPKAVALYQKACFAGNATACADLGLMLHDG